MGNPGHRPLPENELQLEVKFPACPDGLSPEAKKIWKREAKKGYLPPACPAGVC